MTTAAAPEEKLAAPEWGESALRLLARAGRLLGTSLEYQSTLTELAGLIVPELADLCIVNLAEPNGMVRPLEVVHRDPSAAELVRQRLGPAPVSMEPGASPLTEVMRTGQPRLMPDLTPEQISQLVDGQERLELLRSVGLRSVLVVPMRIRQETVGALALARSHDRLPFDEADQALAQELADRAAVAVDHARLFHSEQAARASAERAAATIGRLGGYATRLNRILEGLVQADTIESVSRFISEEAAAACSATGGWVVRTAPDGHTIEVVATVGGQIANVRALYPSIDVDQELPACWVARTREPLFITSRSERLARFPLAGAAHDALGYHASAVLPLVSEDYCLGVIGFVFDEPREFDSVERDFLSAVARHCSLAFSRIALRRELSETNARLQIEQTRLHTILDHLPAGLLVAEAPSGRLLLHNATAEELLGCNINPGDGFQLPEDFPLARALRTGEVVNREERRYRRPDGKVVRLTSSAAPVCDAAGRVVYAVTVFQDVTRQGELEEALHAERDRLRLVLNAARMGTWQWDLASNAVTWDDNLCELYGLAPGRGAPTYEAFLALVHPEDRGFVDASTRRAMREGGSLIYEFRIITPNGKLKWIADQGQVFTDSQGQPVYFAGVCMDVTERRRAEEHLREAQKLNAVGRLAGGMAHEINNMMTVALGFCDFLLRDPLVPDTLRGDIGEIHRASERAASVTRQVLAFSRQQLMLVEPVDLNQIVTETHQMLRRLLDAPIEIDVDMAAGIGAIQGDRNYLSQILVNLALNARDAMPEGGRLTIRTEAARLDSPHLMDHDGTPVPPDDYVLLTVSDTGSGMDHDTLGHIFEPFFTTKTVGEGTGLGLSTVYGIVKQTHGFIWVHSEPGRGTAFRIAFPRAEQPARAEVIAPVGYPERAGGERVLLVEDEPMVRDVAARALKDMGYRVELASDGDEALARLEQSPTLGPVDLVLTDIMMPHSDGHELGNRLRERFPDLPVIYMSGHPSEEMIGRGLLDAGEHFIQKPFLPERLGERVRAVMDRR